MNNKKKFFSQMLSLILVASLLLGNMNLTTASASTVDRSTVYFGTDSDDVYGTKRAEWVTEGQEAKITLDVTANKTLGNVSQVTKTDIVLVIDVSTSMRDNDRIDNVKVAAKDFVLGLLQGTNKQSVQVGLVTYGEEASIKSALTNEDGSLISEINKIAITNNTGTNIQAGIRKANQMLVASKINHGSDSVNQLIILLSDGAPTYSIKANDYDSINQRLIFPTGNVTTVGSGSNYNLYATNWWGGYDFDDRYDVDYTIPVAKTANVIEFNSSYYTISRKKITNVTNLTAGTVYRIELKKDGKNWETKGNSYIPSGTEIKSGDSRIRVISGKTYLELTVFTATYTVNEARTFSVTNNGVPTVHEAAAVKENETTIYTIGYDIIVGSDAEYVMSSVASEGKFKRASTTNSASSIEEILKSISKQVQQVIDTAKGAKVVDQIPAWFKVDKSKLPTDVTYNETNHTVTWNLGDLKVPDGQDTITKTVDIFLMLDATKLNANVVASTGNMIETNLGCTLSYLDSNKDTQNVTTTTSTGIDGNPALPVSTYDYSITYNIEGNGSTITGSTINETGKAFLGDKIPVKSSLASLVLDSSKYQQPEVTGQVITEATNKFLLVGSDDQLNKATVNVKLNRYTVTFYNKESGSLDNSSYIEPQTIVYGTKANKPLTPPTKAQNNENTYEFSNWSVTDSQLANVTNNLDVYPNFKSASRMYTISFYTDINATIPIATFTAPFGSNNITAPTAPFAPSNPDANYNYTFKVWDRSWNNITTPEDIRVNGTFNSTLKICDVYFYDVTGKLINVLPQKVTYGSAAQEPTDFIKEAVDKDDNNSIRVFDGTWDVPFTSVNTAELHVKANFNLVDRFYTVNYYDSLDAKDPIFTHEVQYKTESIYGGNTPIKVDDTNHYAYTFNDTWSLKDTTPANDLLKHVVSDMNVYAGFNSKENTFTFTFKYWNEEGEDTQVEYTNIPWDGSVTPPEVRTVTGPGFSKAFNGWSGDSYSNIKKNGTATATDQMTYEVTFIYGGGKSATQLVLAGGTATPPESSLLNYKDERNNYEFANWDNEYTNIQGPTVINANYTSTPREYTVIFVNNVTNKVIGEIHSGLHYGDTVNVPTPEVVTTEQYVYNFNHWSETIGNQVTVTGNATYTAYYTHTLRQYVVNFVNVSMTDNSETVTANNQPMWNEPVNYGGDATAAAATATSKINTSDLNTNKYNYTFKGWVTSVGGTEAAQFNQITGDTTVYASYSRELVDYTVIFKDDVDHGNKEIARETIEYGKSATLPEVTKEADTVEFVYQTPTWNFETWAKIWENKQFDENRIIIITLYRPSQAAYHEVEFYSEDGSMKLYDDQNKPYLFRYNTKIDSAPGNQSDYQTTTHNYSFVGWGTQPNSEGDLVDFTTLTVTGPGIKLYAQFQESDRYYKVTFLDENGHDFDATPHVVSVLYGGNTAGDQIREIAELAAENYALAHSTPSTKVSFLGWSTTSAETEQVEASELTNVTRDMTVFAMNADTTNLYTVTYMSDEYEETNNGIFATDIVTGGAIVSFANSDQENTYVIRQAGPTKTSDSHLFTFDHWRVFVKDGEEFFELFGEEGGVEARYSTEILIEALQTNLYLFPVFESSVKTFTVTFQDFDGRVLKTETGVVYDKPATAPSNPSRSDVYTSTTRTVYTFNGWDVDFSKIKADTTVTARYNTVVYDITPSTPVTPTTPPTVAPTPSPVVEDIEDIEDITEDIPQGTPEIPQGTPEVDNEDDSLPEEDTDDEVLDIDGNVIPQGTPELPQTGTAPVGIFYGIGIACAFIGASIIISSKKKREEEC